MKDKIWQTIKDEVTLRIEAEPSLKPYLETLVISKKSLISSVAAILSSKLRRSNDRSCNGCCDR